MISTSNWCSNKLVKSNGIGVSPNLHDAIKCGLPFYFILSTLVEVHPVIEDESISTQAKNKRVWEFLNTLSYDKFEYVKDRWEESDKTVPSGVHRLPAYLNGSFVKISDKSDFDDISDPAILDYINQISATIKIPNKVEHAVRHIPTHALLKINKDTNVAMEKCLKFVSKVTTHHINEDGKPVMNTGFKRLNSKIMEYVYGRKDSGYRIYQAVIEALQLGTEKYGAIIEVDNHYVRGEHSRSYKISEHYSHCGTTLYTLKTKKAIETNRRDLYKSFANSENSELVSAMCRSYSDFKLPSIAEIREYYKNKIVGRVKYKNGEHYTYVMTKPKVKNCGENYITFNDQITVFKQLTLNGYMMPIVGGVKSGGRVVDSFTLIPSWIRDMVTIDKKKIKQYDCKALHPNIAISVWGSEEEQELINGDVHAIIAEKLGIDREVAKQENVSYFNKPINQMKTSLVHQFYEEYTPTMLNNIMVEKYLYGYKTTSKTLFRVESTLMNDVARCISKNIPIMPVYDAIYSIHDEVGAIMNAKLEEAGIKSFVENAGKLPDDYLVFKQYDTKNRFKSFQDEVTTKEILEKIHNNIPNDEFEDIDEHVDKTYSYRKKPTYKLIKMKLSKKSKFLIDLVA